MSVEFLSANSTASSQVPPVRVARFPRLRYMGSKYKLVPALHGVFDGIGGRTALDAFSGSGVVSYLLKADGFAVTSNDFLNFPGTITRATVANSESTLSSDVVDSICDRSLDDRDFIRSKFSGLFLSDTDLRFLDSAWSHIDCLTGFERDIALSALILSAARKQPRGVFTFTGARYDDGRRDLHLPMADHFRERVAEYNETVFSNGAESTSITGDVAALTDSTYDIVYLDPPYAPPSDDADYIKRYHFLEGLSVYWRGQTIMESTKTKKLVKKYTPFAYKRSIEDAMANTFEQFRESGALVLSYSSNAVPSKQRIVDIMSTVKPSVVVHEIDHRYSFGTHAAAARSSVREYIFVGRD